MLLAGETGVFQHPDFDDHEQVIFARDVAAGLSAIVAVHSTALGPAFGGCRMWPYRDEAEALTDALRLSRGMTCKAAICGLPYGGGKSVILGDPRGAKTPALLRAMGQLVDRLGGRYVIADDIGTTLDDLRTMREVTAHTAAATLAAGQSLPVTAYGVFQAIRAAVDHRLGRQDVAGLRVAVQGLGAVGLPLCRYLAEAGAALIVTDLDRARAAEAARTFGALAVEPEAIYGQPADVFAPCALGAVLNDRSIARLGARIVCGGANNQLAEARHAAALAARGILFVPDYIANAGGVIDFHQERTGDDAPQAVLGAVARIHEITSDVLERAARAGEMPLEVADRIVRERLAAARQRARAPSNSGPDGSDDAGPAPH
jgi:leucine dehydrogenase